MNAIQGYRLKVATISDLSRLLDTYRREIMKILARDYARLVARKAMTDLDLSRLGMAKPHPDRLERASSEVAQHLAEKEFILNGRDLNCKIQFYMMDNAVLARFLSGNPEYLRTWENRKDVIRWHWSPEARPTGISEANWETRERYWEAATRKPTIGAGVKFILIDEQLPVLGWSGIHRHLPEYEARMNVCVEKIAVAQGGTTATLKRNELEKIRQRVKSTIPERPAKEHFLDRTASSGTRVARSEVRVSVSKEPQQAATAAKEPPAPVRKAMIDHADVVLGNDGRTFLAVPYVGMALDTRVFIQVSGTQVNISQGSVQFGSVNNVPRAAVDHLRMCETVTLVEIEHSGGRRLLRAKHIAIVKDISMFDNAMRPLVGFVRTQSRRGTEETNEWNSTQ